MIDLHVNFLRFRHRPIARVIRRLTSFLLIGPGNWPTEFVKPTTNRLQIESGSPNLYFHVPFCRSICPHCPYVKCSYEQAKAECYRTAVLRDLDDYLHRYTLKRIHTLYFGGGTPSLCLDLVDDVLERCSHLLDADTEIGIELHPLDCGSRLPSQLRSRGVTHVSLGIETFESGLLKKLGRGYTPKRAEEALEQLLSEPFECVDANLIYGIPGQQPDDALSDAMRCAEIGAHQISAYPLIAFEGTPFGRRSSRRRGMRYGVRRRMQTQRRMALVLTSAGFIRTSIWSYSKYGVRPYTTVTRSDYKGFGLGAGSLLDGVYSFNTFNLEAYCALQRAETALQMQANDRMRRVHWLYWAAYRTRIDGIEYRERFNRDLERDFRPWLQLLSGFGLAKREGLVWHLNHRGADWVHQLQSLYSLSYIDQLWKQCDMEPWPERVALK